MISISSISQLIGLLESHGKIATAAGRLDPRHTRCFRHSTPRHKSRRIAQGFFPVVQGKCENNTSPFLWKTNITMDKHGKVISLYRGYINRLYQVST